MLAGPTFGYQTIGADRSVNADVAADEADALLGLEAAYDGTQIEYSEGQGFWQDDTYVNATVATVTNNVDEALAVSAEVAAVDWGGNDDRVLDVANQGEFVNPVGPDGTQDLVLSCSGDVTGTAPDATVWLSVEASGSDVSIDREPYPVTGVSFDCEGSSSPGDGDPPTDPVPIDDPQIHLTAGSASSGGIGGSSVTFPLENTGDSPVRITGVQVSDAGPATRIQYDAFFWSGPEVDVGSNDQGTVDVADGISIGGDGPSYDFDDNATLTAGEAPTVTLESFRDGSDGFVNMSGETVTLVLYVEGLDVPDREGPVPVEMTLSVG